MTVFATRVYVLSRSFVQYAFLCIFYFLVLFSTGVFSDAN